ncbi:prolyl endopeptidase FAP-like [Oscarella lobularis]|uniref:prolyl endopeptidase FAP-like n=1 Tax=Oscarella lobularis TaxID=121494 RepID=UPI0033133006
MSDQETPPSNSEDTILLEPKTKSSSISSKKDAKRSSLKRKVVVNGLILLALCIIAVVVLVPVLRRNKSSSSSAKKKFDLDSMTDPNLKPKSYSHTWIPNADLYIHRLVTSDGSPADYVLIDPTQPNVTVEILISNTTMDSVNASSAIFSADLQFAILLSDVKPIYRHSFNATYHLYDRSSGNVTLFSGVSQKQIQYMGWSSSNHSLVFVQDHDIFLQLDFELDAVAVTNDGPEIFDGTPDWVYEEEVFGTNYALWWSKNDSFLCYISFNDTSVIHFEFPYYGDTIYGRTYSIPYPKAGFPNPTVVVTIVDVKNPSSKFTVSAPIDVLTDDHIVQSVTWANDSTVAVVWMNRVQNESVTLLCDAMTSSCRQFFENKNSNGWLTIKKYLFTSSGDRFATVLSRSFGSDSFPQIALFDTNDDIGSPVFLTSGNFTVDVLVSFSEDETLIYYTSTEGKEGSKSTQRHLWSVAISGQFEKTCLTCESSCGYASASFSHSKLWYFMTCHGPDVPVYSLANTVDTSLVTVVENNDELRENLEQLDMPKIEYFRLVTESNRQGLSAMRLLPPNFDKTKKYPVFFEVYGGPGYQKVTEIFGLRWHTYIASSLDVIVVMLDGRGSCCQGDNFMQSVYRQLGRFESQDVVESARALKTDYSYVDADRFGAWGWSFGGYLTSMVASNGSGEIKTAIAVAPVTSWRYYDSIYTERYNGLPTSEDNLQAYETYSVMNPAANFSGVDYLLIHGTADDNVHFQNTAQLVKSLTEAGVDYQVQFYTDKQHGLEGSATQRALYKLMSKFLANSFGIEARV